jgi:hypothetical protein
MTATAPTSLPATHRNAIRQLVAFAATFALLLSGALASTASAGTYQVQVCGSGSNSAFNNPYSQNGHFQLDNCATTTAEGIGAFMRISTPGYSISPNELADWDAYAPSGTYISYYSIGVLSANEDPASAGEQVVVNGLTTAGSYYESNAPNYPYASRCGYNALPCNESFDATAFQKADSIPLSQVNMALYCADSSGCGGNVDERAYNATLDVVDTQQPTLQYGAGAVFGSGTNGWHHAGDTGTGGVIQPGSGVGSDYLVIDGHNYGTDTCTHDTTSMRPCPNDTFDFGTGGLADGTHTLQLYATNAAGDGPVLLYQNTDYQVDSTPPGTPTALALDAPQSNWSASSARVLRWTNSSGDVAPITTARVHICPTSNSTNGGVCLPDQTFTGNNIQTATLDLSGLTSGQYGQYNVRVVLEDQAGNIADPANESDPVTLSYDPTTPGDSNPVHNNGWLNATNIASRPQQISLKPSATFGPSGVAGYAVTTDGSTPGTTITVASDEQSADNFLAKYPVQNLPDGVTTITARAISGAGVGSDKTDSTTIQIDRQPPTASVTDAPDPGVWQRGPVTVAVDGVDQPGLSGMTPAPSGEPITAGGYVTLREDSRAAQSNPGPSGVYTISDDGTHTIAYSATDVAGNVSQVQTRVVRIDQSAPQIAAFTAQDPNDPLALGVVVSDDISGIDGTDSVIQQAPAGGDQWASLPTTYSGGLLHARIASDSTPGAVQFRAIVYNVAGNFRVATTRQDGSAMVLQFPLRFATRLTASATPLALKTCKTVKKRVRIAHSRKTKIKKVRVCTTKVPVVAPGQAIRVANGSKQRLYGLLTDANGHPIENQPVTVLQQVRDQTAQTTAATTTTNQLGQLSWLAPGGPSRTIVFRYDGTDTLEPSAGSISVAVPVSAAAAKVSPRKVALDQPFTVTGRLLGGHVPAGGVIVTIEGRDNGVWATLPGGVIKTNGSGAFRLRTRITRGIGVYTYPLRVVVASQYGYPFGAATINGGSITVIGH